MGICCSLCEENLPFLGKTMPELSSKQTQTSPWHIDQRTSMSIELFKSESNKRKANLSLLLHYLKSHSKPLIKKHFSTWRNFHIVELDSLSEVPDFDIFEEEEDHPEVRIDKNNLLEAQTKIKNENLQVIKDCPLYSYVEIQVESGEQPMPLSSLMRFFEEMMDKKYEADLANLQIKRPLSAIPDFFLDHLVRVYGLKKLAQKAMWQMLGTLKLLCEQNHSYGKIICRLLQVYDSQPIPTQLAWFITKARYEFKKVLSSRKSLKSRKNEEIHLVEAVSLVYNLFDSDKFSRAKALSLLKPKIMTDEEFLMFRVHNRIVRMGSTAEIMFSVLDVEGKGTVQVKSFVEYVKKNLEVMMNETDVKIFQQNFDPKGFGSVTKDVFLAKLQVKSFSEYLKNEVLTVSKSSFLHTFVEVYKIIQLRDTAFLTSLFKTYKKLKISQSDFSEIISKLDNRLHHEQIRDFYEEALLQNSDYSLDGLLLDSLIKMVFKNGIGRRGIRDFRIKKEEIEIVEDKSKAEQIVENFIERSMSPIGKLNRKASGVPEIPIPKRRPSLIEGGKGKGVDEVKSGSFTPTARRRASQLEGFKGRGSTPVDDNKNRSKSPAFGFRE